MRITLKTTGFTLTEAIAIYLERRLDAIARLLKHFEEEKKSVRGGKARSPSLRPPATTASSAVGRGLGVSGRGHSAVMARVELGKTTRHHRKGDVFRAEVTLDVPGRSPFRAEAEAGDLRSAIDIVRDELANEVRSWKEKRKDTVRRGGRELKRRLRGE